MSKREKVVRASRNERTSSRVGTLAGRLLTKLERLNGNQIYVMNDLDFVVVCSKEDIQSVLASALTQRPAGKPVAKKPKRKP